jgi:hypothetical protein
MTTPHLNGQEMVPATDRTPNGRFAAGWRGGPGRPKRATEARYLTVLSEAVSEETWRRIAERAVADALAGDHQARVWLSGYLIGRPRQATEPSASDRGDYDSDVLMQVVVGVLEEFDNSVEIKVRMGQAFRLLEEGCPDAGEAVRIAMSEPYPYAYAGSPSADTQRERAEACESPRAEPQVFALVGSSVAAVHGF